jgi:hypothetical protein
MLRLGWLSALAGALILAAGCNPTFAPPMRAVQYGAPARLEQGRVELGGTVGGISIPNVGGPHLAVGVTDNFAIEAGGNFLYDEWATGFVGARFSYAGDRRRRAYLIADLELGVGAGLGGERDGNQAPGSGCDFCDGRTAMERIAWGGYQGVGLGAQIRWFSIFGRFRVEESKATNVPTTLWPSFSVGMEFRVHDQVALNLGAGVMAYTNSRDNAFGFFYQFGVTLFFDQRTPPPRPAPEPEPRPQPPLQPLPQPPPQPLPQPPPQPPAAEPWAPRPPLAPVPDPPPVPDPFDEDDTTYD